MTSPRPPEYTDGYGELVRAYRLYLGLSQRTMAEHIGIKERSLSDIETGRRGCPVGFVDTVERITEQFDTEVESAVKIARDMLSGQHEGDTISIEVSDKPHAEWQRAVVSRAAVESGLIMPSLIGNHRTQENRGRP